MIYGDGSLTNYDHPYLEPPITQRDGAGAWGPRNRGAMGHGIDIRWRTETYLQTNLAHFADIFCRENARPWLIETVLSKQSFFRGSLLEI